MNKQLILLITVSFVFNNYINTGDRALRDLAASKHNVPGTVVRVTCRPRSSSDSSNETKASRRKQTIQHSSRRPVSNASSRHRLSTGSRSSLLMVPTSTSNILVTQERLDQRLSWHERFECWVMAGGAALATVAVPALVIGIKNAIDIHTLQQG